MPASATRAAMSRMSAPHQLHSRSRAGSTRVSTTTAAASPTTAATNMLTWADRLIRAPVMERSSASRYQTYTPTQDRAATRLCVAQLSSSRQWLAEGRARLRPVLPRRQLKAEELVQRAPSQYVPVQRAPSQYVPVQRAPSQYAPVHREPFQEVVVQRAPSQYAPVQRAPFQEVVVQRAP